MKLLNNIRVKATFRGTIAAAMLVLTLTAPVFANLIDSPLPTFSGHTTLHVFSVSGVQSTPGSGSLETLFACTSLERTKPIIFGVEAFDYVGGAPVNDATLSQLTLGPGQTGVVSTASGLTPAFVAEGMDLSGPVLGGSARILSTSKRIACTAMLSDGGNPNGNLFPQTMTNLPVIKKTLQKGD